MRIFFCCFFTVCLHCNILAQNDSCCIQAISAPAMPATFLKLRIGNDSIYNNDVLNEDVVDMVKVKERDEKVPTWFTTHQGGGFGWFIRTIGFWWQAVDRKRYKFVGTNKNNLSLPAKDELTEHDINFNLIPHLPHYLNFVYRGRTTQVKHKYNFKRARKRDTTKPPYIEPTLETAEVYELHCELTPPKKLRDSVSFLFYPCMPGPNLDIHPNFCDPKPTVGMYGVFVLDCNHACHPEIHPYEWLWWLRVTPEQRTGGNFNKEWMIGFFRESSNRFILWSQRPRVGTISIPFIFKTNETKSYLKLSHIVTGNFRPGGIKRMKGLPKNMHDFSFSDTTFNIRLSEDKIFPLQICTNRIIKTRAMRWWLSDIQTDANKEWVWGYFNMVVSVGNGYTAKLESIANK